MDIQKIFEKIKNNSFQEVDAELIEKSEATLPPGFTDFFMLGDPITGNIFYTQERVEQLSEEAMEGIIAHELAHQIQAINTETRFNKEKSLELLKKYKDDKKFRKEVESQADLIAVNRGYGKQLIQLFKELPNQFNKERMKSFFEVHLSIEEIKKLI